MPHNLRKSKQIRIMQTLIAPDMNQWKVNLNPDSEQIIASIEFECTVYWVYTALYIPSIHYTFLTYCASNIFLLADVVDDQLSIILLVRTASGKLHTRLPPENEWNSDPISLLTCLLSTWKENSAIFLSQQIIQLR